MCDINLLELGVVDETTVFFAIKLHIALNISFNWTRLYLFNDTSAELLEEHIKGSVKAETIFKCNLGFHGIRLSEKLHILLELVHVID
jgi:hypothetical protein